MEQSEFQNNQPAKQRPKVQWWAIIATAIVLSAIVIYTLIFSGLPTAEEIKNYRPESTVKYGAVDLSQPPHEAVRIWTPLKQISPQLQQAVVFSEDDLFYQHNGVNIDLMLEAFKINWEKKRYVRGAGTITMQFVRNAFLTKEKTILRKIREIILARRVEETLTKSQILEHYLNIVEWGTNIYGAEAASLYYFNKSASNLNLKEASLLAGMLPNPIYFNPFKRLQSCKRMQKRVLWLMQINRKLTAEEVSTTFASPLYLRGMAMEPQSAEIDSLEEAKYEIPELEEKLPPLPIRQSSMPDSIAPPDTSDTDSLEVPLSEQTLPDTTVH